MCPQDTFVTAYNFY